MLTLHYEEGLLYGMKVGTNQDFLFSYDEDGKPFAVWYNGTQYYYETNLQGDVVSILDVSGNEVASYAYNAWGKQTSADPSSEIGKYNPLRYRGYVYDTDMKWYYLQSRYYDPEIGRFINIDEPSMLLGDQENLLQYNLYVYCFNNPVNFSDSNGHTPIQAVFAAIGGWGCCSRMVCSGSVNSYTKRIYFFKPKINCLYTIVDLQISGNKMDKK